MLIPAKPPGGCTQLMRGMLAPGIGAAAVSAEAARDMRVLERRREGRDKLACWADAHSETEAPANL